jgi:hypothetical protein
MPQTNGSGLGPNRCRTIQYEYQIWDGTIPGVRSKEIVELKVHHFQSGIFRPATPARTPLRLIIPGASRVEASVYE